MMPPVYKVDKILLSRTLKKVPLVTELHHDNQHRIEVRLSSAILSRDDHLSAFNGNHMVLMTNDRSISRRKKATNILISRYDDLALFRFFHSPEGLRYFDCHSFWDVWVSRSIHLGLHLLVLHINTCFFEIK